MQVRRVLAATSILTFATACGSSRDDGVSPGGNLPSSFSATVTGGSAGSYTGLSSAAPASGLFGIGLTTADGKFLLSFARTGARPTTGTYPLGTNPLVGFTASINVGPVGPGQFAYTSTSGALTITESSPSSIKGSFSFTAQATFGGGPAASVTGSFSAVCPTGC